MAIQEYTPVSILQKDYLATIKKTEQGPVVLSQYSRPIAVLLSTAEYERLANAESELRRLQRLEKYRKDFAEMRQGKYTEG